MDLMSLIHSRQSCRNFDAKVILKDDLDFCVEAARLAPSACNAQPMFFTVCTGESAKKVADYVQDLGINEFAKDVPCFIIVSENKYNFTSALGSRIKNQDFRSIDIGIAVAYLTLAATSKGLATCILGWFNEKKIQKLLNIKKAIKLVVALGYAKQNDLLRSKLRKPIEDFAKFQ